MPSRQGGRETAEAVLEVAWAITNLAAGQHDIVKTVLLSAPALIAHLSGWLGLPVAEQCAWALGENPCKMPYRELMIRHWCTGEIVNSAAHTNEIGWKKRFEERRQL